MLTQERLRELYHYDKETGVFKRKVDHKGLDYYNIGREFLWVEERRYLKDKLAWLYVVGYTPLRRMIHINGDPYDNSIFNLRETLVGGKPDNIKIGRRDSGCVGIRWMVREQQWYARLWIGCGYKELGYFDQLIDAILAKRAANIKQGFKPEAGILIR